ncbi:hypothetical protein [Glutamicibacter sp. V16R2B1]|uniref:hypothetical protein n=1 Tax=Glutamicibacter sp. V16R2B1 TaxID=2036207 RepID=UPI0010FCEB2A|nr:hypothetical protein [Glutamicibacter sp. V16R2B1]TLK50914.1 hypothetical protein FDN03_10820 [Glutamicibacter sp. V16R2B1]
MSAESNAISHALAFSWWRGCPELSDEEARLHDLLTLHRAKVELIREQRDLLRYYDSDEELGISSDP